MTESDAYLAFAVFPGIGPVRCKLLREYFSSLTLAYQAPKQDLINVGLPSTLIDNFIAFRNDFSVALYRQNLEKTSVRVLAQCDDTYPQKLKEISDAPLVLFVKGDASSELLSHEKLIGIVGTRHMTAYGKQMAEALAADLCAYGCIVVSGMAWGIDAVAHTASLEAHAKTIAVLGCGVDIIAPMQNKPIYDQLCAGGGAVVSEVPLGVMPSKGLFPARNRIISGLCSGIVVIEGDLTSGSLITARYAADQGREVFALPGAVTSIMSKGPNQLIKDGAHPVSAAEDIVRVLGWSTHSVYVSSDDALIFNGTDPLEKQIIMTLAHESYSIDDLSALLDIPMPQLLSALTQLEIDNKVSAIGGGKYALVRSRV